MIHVGMRCNKPKDLGQAVALHVANWIHRVLLLIEIAVHPFFRQRKNGSFGFFNGLGCFSVAYIDHGGVPTVMRF